MIAATPEYLFVGGFSGELVIKNLRNEEAPAILKNYSTDPNCITNHLSSSGNVVLLSCNDCTLRQFDLGANKMRSIARFPYALNATEAQPGGSLLACVGDSRKVRLLDSREGFAEVAALTGHQDFAFSCSWSPDGQLLATGSQDHTARIYDTRQLKEALHCFTSEMAPVRRVLFSPCGRLLAVMEADDFVHLYSTGTGFKEGQVIDFFGEISGIAFDPAGDSLYIGCAGMENGGILEFRN